MLKNWFFEKLYPDIKIAYTKDKVIYKERSRYQTIEIFENKSLGRMLALDGIIQTTERDEFIYHEMLTHPPLLLHPNPENILIIGGGDGGVLREVFKHKVKKVTLVEIDKKVIEVSRKHLRNICANSFFNRKLNLQITDGAKFVKETCDKFDVIIIDSSDPVGPAKILFKKKFYENMKRILNKNGIIVRQTGSTFFQNRELKSTFKTSKKVFKHTHIYVIAIPTYVGGFFSLMYASNHINPEKTNQTAITKRYNRLELKTRYYTPQVYSAALTTPPYITQIIK